MRKPRLKKMSRNPYTLKSYSNTYQPPPSKNHYISYRKVEHLYGVDKWTS